MNKLTLEYLYADFRSAAEFTTEYASIFFGKYSNYFNCSSAKNDWYYEILFLKGMSSYRLGTFKTSTAIFERLTQYDGKNEAFKNWYRYSIYRKNRRISKTITIVCILLLLTESVFKKQITSYPLKFTMLGFAMVGLIGSLFFDQYIKRAFKKTPVEKVS